jgi:hypothetical protein
MRRVKKLAGTHYIDARISQLKSDRDLSNNPVDVMWYNRTMQELDWAKQAITGEYSEQCVLERSA